MPINPMDHSFESFRHEVVPAPRVVELLSQRGRELVLLALQLLGCVPKIV